jgi:hypothetical protein
MQGNQLVERFGGGNRKRGVAEHVISPVVRRLQGSSRLPKTPEILASESGLVTGRPRRQCATIIWSSRWLYIDLDQNIAVLLTSVVKPVRKETAATVSVMSGVGPLLCTELPVRDVTLMVSIGGQSGPVSKRPTAGSMYPQYDPRDRACRPIAFVEGS